MGPVMDGAGLSGADGSPYDTEGSLHRGDGTRQRILEAALQVLGDVGCAQFSVQKVARTAGVYQGNITYYWPRRRDLVRAVAVRVAENYRRAVVAALEGTTGRPAAQLEHVISMMVHGDEDRLQARVLPELWALANTDAEVAQVVARTHDDVMELLLDALGIVEDDPRHPEVVGVLLLIGAAIQGARALHGHRGLDDPVLVQVKRAIVSHHVRLMATALGEVAG